MNASDRPCPFSKNRLQELYHEEFFSLLEIGRLACNLEGWPTCSDKTVRRWFLEFGIQIRGRSENTRIVNTRRGKGCILPALSARHESLRNGTGQTNYSNLTRRSSITKSAKGRQKRETRTCEGPNCQQTITRIPSEFRTVRTFCSKACSNRYRGAASKERRVLAPIPVKPIHIPEWAAPFVDRLNEIRTAEPE